MEYYLKGDYIMIGIFFRAIAVVLICIPAMLAVFFGFAVIFVCELASRIIYAESVINEFDWGYLKESFDGMLNAAKEYILG